MAIVKSITLFFVLFPFILLGQELQNCLFKGDLPFDNNCQMGENVVFAIRDATCDDNPYILVFEDDFNGNSVDLTKWYVINGVVRDPNFSMSKYWNTSKNLVVENGYLNIITEKEPLTNKCFNIENINYCSDFDFTSGEINSINKFLYGKFEIRCMIPKGKGFWPAFWMYGEDVNRVNNEIDVFEFWKNCTRDHNMTVHYNHKSCLKDDFGTDYSDGYHIFTVIWDPFVIEWWVDGVLKRRDAKFLDFDTRTPSTCNSIKANNFYFLNDIFPQDPMNVIADLAIESPSDLKPDESTPFPSSFVIDYIRVYQKNTCEGNLVISSGLDFPDNIYTLIIGETILINPFFSDVIIHNGEIVEFVATEEISIEPTLVKDVIIEEGSDFTARINPTACPPEGDNFILIELINKNKQKGEPIDSNTNSKNNGITLYPNPNSGRFVVSSDERDINFDLYIFDALTQKIIEAKNITTAIHPVDLSHFAKGTYFLKIIDHVDKKAYVHKIIFE